MSEEVANKKNRWSTVARLLWYGCATILVLSLPTFSYLVPTEPTKPLRSEFLQNSGGSSRVSSASTRSPAGFTGSSGGWFGPSGLGSRSTLPSRKKSNIARSSGPNSKKRVPRRKTRARSKVTPAKNAAGPGKPDKEERKNLTAPQRAFPAASTLASELSQMEQDYQNTRSSLFPASGYGQGAYSANPFSAALNGQGGGDSSSQPDSSDSDSGSDAASDTSSGETSGDTSGEGTDTGGDDGSSEGSSEGSDTAEPGAGTGTDEPSEPEPGVYEFLLLGDFDGDGQNLVSRAFREESGTFVMESGHRITLFSGGVGLPQVRVGVKEGDILLTGDFSGDGWDDVVASRAESLGTVVQGWERKGLASLELRFKAFFPYRAVGGAALFDFDSDKANELCLLFRDEDDISIYEITGEDLLYVKDVVVPFRPAILLPTTDHGVINDRYLQVFDASLQRSVVFSSRYSGVYSFGRPPTFRRNESVLLESATSEDAAKEYLILRYDDRIGIVNDTGDNVVFLGSFGTSYRFPTILVGPVDDAKTNSLFLWP